MRLLILFIAVMFSFDSYATIYEKYQNGVPEFSNQQSQGAKQLNLSDDPVSVIDMNSIPHTIVWVVLSSSNIYLIHNYKRIRFREHSQKNLQITILIFMGEIINIIA